jgi:hypothetical protein
MRLFSIEQFNQGSGWWWEVRRGIPTASCFGRIVTPVGKRCDLPTGHTPPCKTGGTGKKPPGSIRCPVHVPQLSAGAAAYLAELAAQVALEDGHYMHWVTERMNKPPNHAIAEGVRREAESRAWLAMERDVTIIQVGFCLSDCGMYGCSPDGILVADSGCMDGTLEAKNPTLETHVGRLEYGGLPSDYKCQCHGHLVVCELPRCTWLSYCPPLDPLVVDVFPDDFTRRLKTAVGEFVSRYLELLDRLKLRNRFNDIRQSVLSHFPEGRA